MKKRLSRGVLAFYVLVSGTILLPSAGRAESNSVIQSPIKETPLQADLVMKIGSDRENEDFFKPRSFAIDREGRIFILDSGNSRIQCFSPEGKFIFSFGRFGQGPGELTKEAHKIKILEDGNIYVIDNHQRKINVYDARGKYLSSEITADYFDDIVLIGGVYYVSNILMKENHQPVHVSNKPGKIDKSFGLFVDPDGDLLDRMIPLRKKTNAPTLWEDVLNDGGFTSLLINSKKEIIYSQQYPYRLIKYDPEGRVIRNISGEVDFDSGMRTIVGINGKWVSIGTKPPVARFFKPSLLDEDRLACLYLNPEADFFFLDLFDRDLRLISRHKMPNYLVSRKREKNRPQEYFGETLLDRDNNFYALLLSQENSPQLVKYKLRY
jgi:hypothetical protein